MTSLDVSDAYRLAADLNRSSGRVGAKAAAVVRKAGQQVKTQAQALAPVQTGALRESIGVTYAGDGRGAGILATISPTVRYAPFVELGTSVMAPRPFLAPALDAVEPSFVAAMERLGEDPFGA